MMLALKSVVFTEKESNKNGSQCSTFHSKPSIKGSGGLMLFMRILSKPSFVLWDFTKFCSMEYISHRFNLLLPVTTNALSKFLLEEFLKEAPPLHQILLQKNPSPLSRPGFPFVRLGEEHLWCFLVIWQGQDQGVVHVLPEGGWLAPQVVFGSLVILFQVEKKEGLRKWKSCYLDVCPKKR